MPPPSWTVGICRLGSQTGYSQPNRHSVNSPGATPAANAGHHNAANSGMSLTLAQRMHAGEGRAERLWAGFRSRACNHRGRVLLLEPNLTGHNVADPTGVVLATACYLSRKSHLKTPDVTQCPNSLSQPPHGQAARTAVTPGRHRSIPLARTAIRWAGRAADHPRRHLKCKCCVV